MAIISDEDLEQLKEEHNNYYELVQTLHNEMDNIPKSVKDKIWDMVYKRFQP